MSRISRQRAALLLVATVSITGCKLLQDTSRLEKIRDQYYSLTPAGITEYHCEAAVDWTTFYTTLDKKPPADTPLLRYLQQAHMTFSAPLAGTATVQWVTSGAPPKGLEDKVKTLLNSFKTMLGGFLSAWRPVLRGTLLPSLPVSPITPKGNGYILTEHDIQGRITDITMDSGMKITHLSSDASTFTAEIDTTFVPSPKGLLLTQMDSRTHKPPTAPEDHVISRATYAPVQGALIPASLLVITERSQIPMSFSHCGITK